VSAILESEVRAPGLPRPAPPTLADLLAQLEASEASPARAATLKSLAQNTSDAAWRDTLAHCIRWAAIEAYYAGLQAARNAR